MFGPIAEIIETQRLILEPPAVHDADEMAEVLGDPRLHDFMGGEPLTAAELRARYEHLVAGPAPFHQEWWLTWIVRRRRDRRAVGYVQATVTPGTAGTPEASGAREASGSPEAPGTREAPGTPALRADVAWVIGMPYQGFGFATEAAAAMLRWLRDHAVREITAAVHPGNEPSAAVARKLGLHPTASRSGDEVVWRVVWKDMRKDE
ncbi:GNAT family N-acetyltransferase [Actinomadura rudentiformis]|uniref:GNAT family N-acetyltransferase n=1 Tax=Actinomadura rudentiformis TaxID=359158 RepID=A0A6H9YQE5_9ACTN|nr:GNAT family N-acetyltransferase [Actinomadura rudentiformis]KAB2349627.1 GNAT family N-acetyltransferase [Actinomadura rudentiformis]